MRVAAAGPALLAAGVLATASRADVFSPGPLSKGHAALEGLSNCTQCHVAGAQLSQQRCLECHSELGPRIARRKGFHGLIPDGQRSCQECHHEHQGRDFALIDWGKGGRSAFDHRRTGFVLAGKHAALQCQQCHEDRRIADPAIRELRAARPGRETYLGAAVRCSSCHFDEHRGQLGSACNDCHTEKSWAPASGFSHARTAFPLRGKHGTVACLSCHAQVADAASRQAFPPPRSEAFSRFKPVAHSSCVDCHKDAHDGRFGRSCQQCHAEEGWGVIKGMARERAFHEKTRYPLRGAHLDVACRTCHGPFRGAPAVYKGLAFDSCASCHVDAHLGQLGSLRDPGAACDRCHTVQAFAPARYELQDHTRWPLRGAHEAVACSHCHPRDPTLAARAAPVRTFLERRRRSDKVSLTRFHPPGDTARCDTCHADPHGGQFKRRVQQAGCADCHEVSSFKTVRFDHGRETRFALAGAHARTACASCHVPDLAGVVRYASVTTACASCHADVHARQFAPAGGGPTDCTRCHSSGSWKETAFQHRPPFTAFELQGRHASVACAACHREVAVASGVRAKRYRGIPTSCEGCHVDVHRGAFQELAR